MAEIDGLRQQNHELKRANCGMARLVDGLRQQLAAAEARVRELEFDRDNWKDRAERHIRDMELAHNRKIELEAELERVYAHNHDLEDAIAMGEHTVEVLEGRVKKLESELRANTHVCTIQMDQARQAEMERDDVKRELATARTERDGWKETARQYAENTGYWQARAEAAERELATARGQIERYRELARWIERDMMTPARNTCHVPWDALEELVALSNGAEPPNCARCRRDDCWPYCARFYDKPDAGTGEVQGDG